MAVVLQACVLSRQERFLLYSDEDTNTFITAGGSILTFLTLADVTDYARVNQLKIAEYPAQSLSLDSVIEWIHQKDDPNPLLLFDTWNFLYEVANSIPEHGEVFHVRHRELVGLYDRLFWGLNLPAATPKGEHFTPEWSESEKLAMADHLSSGIDLLRTVSSMAVPSECPENLGSAL